MSAVPDQHRARVHGRDLVPGTEVSITGERGRFRFIRATTTSTNRIVFDFIGGTAGHECWRSFYAERVRTVHRINRTRQNVTRHIETGPSICKIAAHETRRPAPTTT